MKDYKKYMDRQSVSEELHKKILESAAPVAEPRRRKRWNPAWAMGSVVVIGAALLAIGIWNFDSPDGSKANMETAVGRPETEMAMGEIVEDAASGRTFSSYQELQTLDFGMLLPEEEQIPLSFQTAYVTESEDGNMEVCRIIFADNDMASYLTLEVNRITGEAGADVWKSSHLEGVFLIHAVKYYDSYQVSYESNGVSEDLLQQIIESVHP